MSVAHAWVTVSLGDLENYLFASQIALGNTFGLDGIQADRFSGIRDNVVDDIRLRCQRHYRVSATAKTIPPELKDACCWIILERLINAIPGMPPLRQDQAESLRDAKKRLQRVEDGQSEISLPLDPIVQAQGISGTKVLRSTTRMVTVNTMLGL